MKINKSTIVKLVLAIVINTTTLSAFSQMQDSVSYYLNGVENWFYQQPDILSFRLDNKGPYSIPYNPTIIDKIEYYGPADGINNIFFSSSATLADKQSVYNSIASTANFEKFFVVPVRAENVNMGHSKNYWMGTDMYINIVFDNPTITLAGVQSLASTYELDIAFAPDQSIEHGVYVLEVKKWHTIEDYYDPALTLKLCKLMYENDSTIIKSLAPSLRMFHPHIPNDPLYISQWWTADNTGYACADTAINPNASIDLECAWNFEQEINDGPSYSGTGIVVGVIDFDGIEITHPDMMGQFLPGWHSLGIGLAIPMNQNLAPVGPQNTKAHLQCVSGIIAANGDNNEGSIGVAYGSKITPGLMTGSSAQINSLLMQFLPISGGNKVDIINMSFGSYGLTLQQAQNLPFHQALLNCHQLGRPIGAPAASYRGIALIASMGNNDSPNSIPYPAGFDFVFSVGATNPFDQRKSTNDGFSPSTGAGAWGSNYWQYMDVAAPGICVTATDITDLEFAQYNYLGYGVGDYYQFAGTSAAAPIVSGIAALIMEKDSNLTNIEVYEAIRLSCEKVGGYTYSNNGPNGRCAELGFGRVNACNALNILSVLSSKDYSDGFTATINTLVTDNVKIVLDKTRKVNISLYSLTGQLISSENYGHKSELNLNMETHAKGLYFIKITDENNHSIFTSKLMKQ